MANVVFKRGTQSALNGLTEFVDGGFYLTSDTNRLYVAQSNSKLVELNKSITVVSAVNQLPLYTTDTDKDVKGSEVEVGQFYYVSSGSNSISGNILAVCTAIDTATKAITWTQVNPDTQNDNIYTTSLSAVKNTSNSSSAQLVYDITLSQAKKASKNAEAITQDSVVGQLTISSSDLAQVVVNVAIDVGAGAVASNKSNIKLSGAGSNGDGFNLVGGNGITLSGGGDSDLTIAGKSYTAESVTAGTNGVLQFQIKDENNASSTATSDSILYNTITVDGSASTVYNQGSLGSFYSASKVDDLILDAKAEMDAMTYRGTIASATDLFALTNCNKGDVYMASGTVTLVTGRVADTGDLLIFKANDNSENVADNWDIVPSGNELDTTYTLSAQSNKITLTPSVGEAKTVEIVAGTALSASTSNNAITLNHSNSAVTAGSYGPSSAATLNPNDSFTVPNFTVDAQGHVTAAEGKSITLPGDSQYSVSDPSINVTNGSDAEITLTMTGSGRAQGGTSTASFSIGSDSLTLSKETDGELVVELAWGTF